MHIGCQTDIRTAVKEWAGVIAVLGSGNQILMVRKYAPPTQEFLLYPTFSYCNEFASEPEQFNLKIQPQYRELALREGEKTRKKAQESCLIDLAYFARVSEHVEISSIADWNKLTPFYIWTRDHVSKYVLGAKKGNCSIWILRVFALPKTVEIGRVNQGGPPSLYHHHEGIDVSGSESVLTDEEFKIKRDAILNVLKGA